MSQENVELVRRAFGAVTIPGDPELMIAASDPWPRGCWRCLMPRFAASAAVTKTTSTVPPPSCQDADDPRPTPSPHRLLVRLPRSD